MRTLQNATDLTSAFSESIECYTSEDVPGKPEDVQWFSLGNGTNARIAWKRPTETNGVIQNYLVTYTTDLTESTLNWGNVTVPGNKTFASLTGLVAGKCYDVMVQASTKAGYGRPSNPIFIITGGSSASKVPTKTDEQKPPQKSKPDQSLGRPTKINGLLSMKISPRQSIIRSIDFTFNFCLFRDNNRCEHKHMLYNRVLVQYVLSEEVRAFEIAERERRVTKKSSSHANC